MCTIFFINHVLHVLYSLGEVNKDTEMFCNITHVHFKKIDLYTYLIVGFMSKD